MLPFSDFFSDIMFVESKESGIFATEDAAKDTFLFKIPGSRVDLNFEMYFGIGE